jgi:peptidoglycan hydrolase-like protein with peptidoglycan-binding domain
MYKLGDERAAIREIQKYLHFVSDRVTDEVPRIAIDGFFGEETKDAVRAFQKYKGIDESGTVDFLTFTLLYEEYKLAEFLQEAEGFIIGKELFPLKFGDSGNSILLINIMLNELGKIYRSIGRVDVKPYFSHSTEEAVKNIRAIYMLESIPIVDLLLFDKMQYELLVRAKEK